MKTIDTPAQLVVVLAGTPLAGPDAECLTAVTVRQRASAPAQAELVFQGVGPDLADRFLIFPGLSLTIRNANDDALVFDGDVTAVEHGYGPDGAVEVRVRGYDPLHRLRKQQTLRAHTNVELGGLARDLAGGLGLSVEGEASAAPVERLIQWWQSDLELLAEACRRSGIAFGCEHDRLVLFDGRGRGDSIAMALGDQLVEVGFELNGDRPLDAITAAAWDPATGNRFASRATEPRSGRTAGSRIARGDLGPSEWTLPGLTRGSESEAADAAQTALDRVVAAEMVARGVAIGDARIRPGAKLAITGVALGLEGEFIVTETTHQIDSARGYVVAFRTGPIEDEHRPDRSAAVLPGVVVDADDPDRRGRVRVAFPTIDSVESGWLRVTSVAAGPGRGLCAVPSVDDEVLVILPTGEPRFGVVLGGLYAGDDLDDYGVDAGSVERYVLRTESGESIELNRKRGGVCIRTPNGSRFRLGRESCSIHATTDLEIAAPGRTIRIRAKAVDFQRAAEPEPEEVE